MSERISDSQHNSRFSETASAEISSIRWRNYAALALLILGSFQMIGYALGWPLLRGIGAASAVAPFPKVFGDVAGLETFASDFKLIVETSNGARIEEPITPELYQRLGGPYNRRNVYGAALAYAPRLPKPLWEAVFCHGLAPSGALRREFGLPEKAGRIAVEIRTKTRNRTDMWLLDPPCDW